MSDHVHQMSPQAAPVLVDPDADSEQWVTMVAGLAEVHRRTHRDRQYHRARIERH